MLIYLLIVVNFQSWLDPFVIITALPAALAGIVWMLFATGTTLSVPALTGAIMCMGVATANSILVVSFARERLAATGDPVRAAVEAGFTRFRPVLMTALAMIIGMAPMALGLGEGGEQNAPLGRAVIGGLVFATCATLMFVPVVFSIVHGRARGQGRARRRRAVRRSLCLTRSRCRTADAGPAGHAAPHHAARPEVLGPVAPWSLAIVIAVVGIGLRCYNEPRHRRNWTEDQAVPTVQVIKLKGAKAGGDLTLPGDVQAFTNAPHLCPGLRLCAEMVCRYRRAR